MRIVEGNHELLRVAFLNAGNTKGSGGINASSIVSASSALAYNPAAYHPLNQLVLKQRLGGRPISRGELDAIFGQPTIINLKG